MNEINALNKTAAFHIYADLCEGILFSINLIDL